MLVEVIVGQPAQIAARSSELFQAEASQIFPERSERIIRNESALRKAGQSSAADEDDVVNAVGLLNRDIAALTDLAGQKALFERHRDGPTEAPIQKARDSSHRALVFVDRGNDALDLSFKQSLLKRDFQRLYRHREEQFTGHRGNKASSAEVSERLKTDDPVQRFAVSASALVSRWLLP